ncbi:peroxiredoxin-like family protein [Roseobacter sp. HKCCA0434]|uniref:peroxiredoxin-like family protein n=1 Tax=Roseobacter sp. HKCCA0434 TaxID=3079297 RepID=UPI002905A0C5|nr:peroxiredoxin-like family protein [Roseobacter sp. HKCCA0434]
MPTPAQKAPALDVALTAGGRWDAHAQAPDTFTVIIFYRGKHCPICRDYLKAASGIIGDYADFGAHMIAVSMDSEERAKASYEEWDLGGLPIGYEMTEAQARDWGLFLSSKREGSEEPDLFSEPGLAVLDPEGKVVFTHVQNAPFTRPDLEKLLSGLKFIHKNDYPIRGTAG